MQMPEAATVGVLRKKVFFKIRKIHRKLLCQRKHLSWVRDLITLAQFPGSEMSLSLFKHFMDRHIKPQDPPH